MRPFSKIVSVLVALLMVLPQGAALAAAQTRSAPQVLAITQTVLGTGAGLSATVSARAGAPLFTAQGYDIAGNAREIAGAAAMASLPMRDYGVSMTQSDLLNAGRAHFASYIPSVISGLRNVLASGRYAMALFTYDQRVAVAGTSRPKHLVWSVIVGQDGGPRYGDAQLVDEEPLLVYMVYTPKAVAAGLPAGWAYPEAGVLKWRLVNTRFEPQTDWVAVDTGGAFDEPEAAVDASGAPLPYDPNGKLACLVDRAAAPDCPTGYDDAKGLVDTHAATAAILDYTRRVRPVYDSVPDPAGGFVDRPRLAMDVQRREVTYGSCSSTVKYRNQGEYGFQLDFTVDRYLVSPDGAATQVNRFQGTGVSPTAGFDVTNASVPTSAAASLFDKLVDLANPEGALVPTSSVANLIHLAPLTTVGETLGAIYEKWVDLYSGRCGRGIMLSLRCDSARGKLQFRVADYVICDAERLVIPYADVTAEFDAGSAASGTLVNAGDGTVPPVSYTYAFDGAASLSFVPTLYADRFATAGVPVGGTSCPAGTVWGPYLPPDSGEGPGFSFTPVNGCVGGAPSAAEGPPSCPSPMWLGYTYDSWWGYVPVCVAPLNYSFRLTW